MENLPNSRFFDNMFFFAFPWISHGSIFHGFSMEAGGRQKMWGGVGGGGGSPPHEFSRPGSLGRA